MNDAETIITWDLLQSLGFCDKGDYFGVTPALSLDFGNFKLLAGRSVSKGFAEVVAFSGALKIPRTIGEVFFEMPLQVKSREQGVAWIVWNLDQASNGKIFHPTRNIDWVAEGRQHRYLLPWEVDMAAYNARPHCDVQRDWMRLALKNLAKLLVNTDDASAVEFSFDGSVLMIRCLGQVVAISAFGKAWTTEFMIPAGKLRYLPKRLMQDSVQVSIYKGRLEIGSSSFDGVMEKLT